jgi:hypothetical protein
VAVEVVRRSEGILDSEKFPCKQEVWGFQILYKIGKTKTPLLSPGDRKRMDET